MAKNKARDNERRAIAEKLRKEQQRRERRRSMLILGACIVLVIGLLAAALVPYVKQVRADAKARNTKLSSLGVSTSAASCDPVTEANATGNQDHVQVGTPIKYPAAPPAFGKHWGNFLQGSEIRAFYSRDDRPQIERLVHSLEHGHTILWYDDSVTSGSKTYKDIQAIASKLGDSAYFMAAPWTSKDGAAFPSGKHVALTHWTGPENQKGETQYCGGASGAVVSDFMKKFPRDDAPEPGAA